MPVEDDTCDLHPFVSVLLTAAPWTVTCGRCESCSSSPSLALSEEGREGGWEGEPQHIKSTFLKKLIQVKGKTSDSLSLLNGGATLLGSATKSNFHCTEWYILLVCQTVIWNITGKGSGLERVQLSAKILFSVLFHDYELSMKERNAVNAGLVLSSRTESCCWGNPLAQGLEVYTAQ